MPLDLARDIVLRWDEREPAFVPVLKEGGIDVLLADGAPPAFRQACEAAGIRVAPASELVSGDLAAFRTAASAFREGRWPGVAPGDDSDVASASRQPWVDANEYRVLWLKALSPSKPPVLAYLPDAAAGLAPARVVPYDTLELALIEAWVDGGNYILALEPRYKAALLKRQDQALAAWRKMGRTVRWLKENRALFGRPVRPEITQLVDGGEASAEIANLMVRQGASPAIVAAGEVPAPDPARRCVVVAVSLAPPAGDVRRRILAHAAAGAIVVTDRESWTPWWRVPELKLERDEPDRETFRLGRGAVVAYKTPIDDPHSFALDVIDLLTHPRRPVRAWNELAAIVTATGGPANGRGRLIVRLINYGGPSDVDTLLYVKGNFTGATLLHPGGGPARLKAIRRGAMTEVTVPGLNRIALVVLD